MHAVLEPRLGEVSGQQLRDDVGASVGAAVTSVGDAVGLSVGAAVAGTIGSFAPLGGAVGGADGVGVGMEVGRVVGKAVVGDLVGAGELTPEHTLLRYAVMQMVKLSAKRSLASHPDAWAVAIPSGLL